MNKPLLSLMVNLANVDGKVADAERELIQKIADTKGLSQAETEEIINDPQDMSELNPASFSDDDKFEIMYSIALLMKIDSKLVKNEMEYCRKVAKKLGYNDAVMFEFITKLYVDPNLSTDKEDIKQHVQAYLKK